MHTCFLLADRSSLYLLFFFIFPSKALRLLVFALTRCSLHNLTRCSLHNLLSLTTSFFNLFFSLSTVGLDAAKLANFEESLLFDCVVQNVRHAAQVRAREDRHRKRAGKEADGARPHAFL